MRSTNTFGIHFILRMNKCKDGKAPIYVRITANQTRCELATKKTITPKDWNSAKGMTKPKSEELKVVNSYLEQVRSQLVDHYQKLQISEQTVTAEAIKNSYLGTEKENKTLCILVEYHNKHMATVLAKGTLKNYYTTEKYIRLFLQKNYKVKDMDLNQVNYQFITEFEFFLRNHQAIDHQKKIGTNGVMKHLERLKKMITMAAKMQWLPQDPFQYFQLKFERVERECLTKDELQKIENKLYSLKRIESVKDLFIFSCYTGFAYIDVIQLTPLNVSLGIDGDYWIKTTRTKTNIPVNIPLLPKALAMIQKYKDDPRSLSMGTLFPVISNQKLNLYLKEIADTCGITKNLTFHLARHTFATTVTLTNGVPMETVSKMLGHTKITTTQIYSKVIERKVSDDMLQLKSRLAGLPLLVP